jgi:hypothetical protein
MHSSSIFAFSATLLSGLAFAQNNTAPNNGTVVGGTCMITAPTCPSCAGDVFTGPLEDTYKILCPGVNAKRSLDHAPALKRQAVATFGQCIDTCDVISGCQSVVYNPLNGACAAYTCLVTPSAGLWGAEKLTDAAGTAVALMACPAGVTANTGTTINININIVNNNWGGYAAVVKYGPCQASVVVTNGVKPEDLCKGPGATLQGWSDPGSGSGGSGGAWHTNGGAGWPSGSWGSGSGSGSGSWGAGNGTGSTGGSGSGPKGGSWGAAPSSPTYKQSNDGAVLEQSAFVGAFGAVVAAFLAM